MMNNYGNLIPPPLLPPISSDAKSLYDPSRSGAPIPCSTLRALNGELSNGETGLLNTPSKDFPSPSSSSSSSSARLTGVGGRTPRIIDEIGITDEELITIKTKQLNRLLKGIPKERQKEIKYERRTLKNRGYADSSRKKRLIEKEQIEEHLRQMSRDLEDNKKELRNNRLKIMELIRNSDNLLRSLDQYESGHELKEKIKKNVLNENPPIKEQTKEIFERLGNSKCYMVA